jgi:hypothetical protein
MAPNWQKPAHVPQPEHWASFTWLVKPEDASMGTPLCQACIAPQQQEQQLQMA